MSPAGSEDNRPARCQPLETSVAVDLQNATKSTQMRGRAFCLAIGAIEVHGCRRVQASPGSIVTGIDPEPAGLGASSARVEHWDRGVVGEKSGRSKYVL